MDKKKEKGTSKKLSYILRHNPGSIGIELDKNGWAKVSDILDNLSIARKELIEIVENNDKQRFSFNEDKTMIRANQGHSISVDLEFKTATPPVVLYHGTVGKFVASILKEGLQKRNRNHVHLSQDKDTAIKVGSRRGIPVILIIDSKSMYRDNFKFYKSENGVWLTDEVPTKYITRKI